MMKSMETEDKAEYSRPQQEHRKGDINSSLNHNTAAAASGPLSDLGADDVEMMMSSTQNQQQGTPDEEIAYPMNNRADPSGRIPAPHENDM